MGVSALSVSIATLNSKSDAILAEVKALSVSLAGHAERAARHEKEDAAVERRVHDLEVAHEASLRAVADSEKRARESRGFVKSAFWLAVFTLAATIADRLLTHVYGIHAF